MQHTERPAVAALIRAALDRPNGPGHPICRLRQVVGYSFLLGGSAGFFRNGTGFSSSLLTDCR
jgi:hypothetical protein